jgi:hypothetical protein
MNPDGSTVSYAELVSIGDHLFEKCEEDVACLASRIDALDSGVRNELLVSDILNSFQVFYYYFRIVPDELIGERLELEPASSLIQGVKIDEIELLELLFLVKNHEPLIIVSDGEKAITAFKGKTAFADGLKYIENPPY